MHDYYNLGRYSRPVTTSSSEAQVWFDRGLIWRYGFNHEEAVKCFRKAAECDPGCAMARWGVAYALGPYYNKPWADFNEQDLKQTLVEARRATEEALALADGAAPVEKALIRGLERRYQSDHVVDNEDLRAWSDAYAAAMRKVYAAFPDDPDVAALFAEALMDRTPWQLWDLESGEPAKGADTVEVVAVLEQSLRLSDEREVAHPGLIHLYIHAMEMSPHPEQALRPADTLRDLVPDAGHLRHMPSHIDILRGDYHAALVANERAIEADRKYLEREGPFNFYTLSRCHDYHFKLYAAMFLGRYRPALDAANEMLATVPEALLRQATPPMADWLEGYMPMKAHVLVRFGKWQEILDEPLPDDPYLYRATTAVWHYAKGIAHAALGQTAVAEAEQRRFEEAFARVPETRMFFNYRYVDILAVAAEMLRGEIAYRKDDHEAAFAHLRAAVARDDGLPYDEPWGWMQPTRHALGALLLEQGHMREAAQVYEADLGMHRGYRRISRHPDNVWGLHGYVEALHRLGRHEEADDIQPRLDLAMSRADVEIRASCFCRLGDNCCAL
ncbi:MULTISPECIES: tetratricopeptide repeat protein [unclassified Mesorhizobium]|uniref:tetratricopeptide repeat protein n=1 Tax=unclassified Mesorhizobium TaxID=325217 RepID=UPI000F7645EB|nr:MULTISPECIES: tetratricopeptide repeat protein [unclassified Mesorhizobium]AZO69208.1 tetratricopeptide repeat protein [Mesorhizobium sp. M6A.T.Cr.TU.016.01.1.1]RWP54526.1 MAG: tetratricopeptide repeat protein [Mesorhizobium sp.]RWQ70426.1 MAG: tetratricopeptide repeat protein [Mesorhizobium sp.]